MIPGFIARASLDFAGDLIQERVVADRGHLDE